jgi:hypothetical protein
MSSATEDAEKKREELTKEVKITVHMVDPLDGICELADEFHFPKPNSIEEYLNVGLSTDAALV